MSQSQIQKKVKKALRWYEKAQPWHNEHSDVLAEFARTVLDSPEVIIHTTGEVLDTRRYSVKMPPGRYALVRLEDQPKPKGAPFPSIDCHICGRPDGHHKYDCTA